MQDQIRPTDWLEIVAGLRFDSFKLGVNDLRPASTDFSRRDELWSPRLGLILKPRDNLSIYTSFSRSYLPQSGDQFSGLTSATAELKPERFDNYELGAKWEPVDGLLATVAVYQLDRTNTRATDPLTQQTVLTGAQRSKGVELGLERSISDRWQVSAGYSWQKAEITKTTTAAPAGRDVPIVPRHSFSLWNRYDVSDALGVGLGVIARSSSFASISNTVKLPSYARVDAAALLQGDAGHRGADQCREHLRRRLFPDRAQRQQHRPGRAEDDQGPAPLRLLASKLRGAVADSLEVVDEPAPLLGSAVGLGDAQQEARVDGHPAFAAVRQR